MTTTRSHAAPWTFRRFLAMFTAPAPRRVPAVLTGREAVARHLFGEAVHWGSLDMLDYDNTPHLQAAWLIVADRRIEHAKSSDRFVAAHHGYTPEAWHFLPALAKVDLRESFSKANGRVA